tara:strand:- start:957 stop:2060 length:1104 start_codon:yes stop_codon:yes gene_type:complete
MRRISHFNNSSDDELDLGIKLTDYKKYSSLFSQKDAQPPAEQEIKPAASYQYPLDADVNNQDMLLIRIFKQIQNPMKYSDMVNYQYQKDGNGNVVKGSGKLLTTGEGKNKKLFNRATTKNDRFRQQSKETMKGDSRYIWLPIPQQVSDSIQVDYAEDRLSPIQAAGMALASTGVSKPGEMAGQIVDTLKALKNTGISDQNLNALQTVLAGKAINQLGANVNPQSLITRSSGQILQSNLELLFNGVALRTFPFVFDFTPRSGPESEMVRDIIRTIKMATCAKQGDGLFINSPDLFQFQYVSGGENDHPFLNKFKIGVLENVSVDYTASGTYATYQDGTPVHIRMSLTLKEINPIYAEDYEIEPEGVGY